MQGCVLPFLISFFCLMRYPRIMGIHRKFRLSACNGNDWLVKPDITSNQTHTVVAMSHKIVVGDQDAAENTSIDQLTLQALHWTAIILFCYFYFEIIGSCSGDDCIGIFQAIRNRGFKQSM